MKLSTLTAIALLLLFVAGGLWAYSTAAAGSQAPSLAPCVCCGDDCACVDCACGQLDCPCGDGGPCVCDAGCACCSTSADTPKACCSAVK